MTTTTTTAPAPARTSSLPTLVWLEVRRYARHPLFLVGVALTLYALWAVLDDPPAMDEPMDTGFFPVLCIGMLGVVVAYRLAKSVDLAAAATDAAPVPRTTRTAAQCLATVFPAMVGGVLNLLAMAVYQTRWGADSYLSHIEGTDVVSALAVFVACAGGPLFGILTARWTDFPGAGLLALVVLVAWTMSGTFGLAMDEPSRLSALLHAQAPLAAWSSADGPDQPLWRVEGSPEAHLAYATTLCFLGAVLAVLRDAWGAQRRRLWQASLALGLLAVLLLAVSAIPDPVRPLITG